MSDSTLCANSILCVHTLIMITMEFDWSVYSDGRVCISILHTPGEDPLGYESPAERWSPVQSIEKILLSVVSMLAGVCRSYNNSTSLAVEYD